MWDVSEISAFYSCSRRKVRLGPRNYIRRVYTCRSDFASRCDVLSRTQRKILLKSSSSALAESAI